MQEHIPIQKLDENPQKTKIPPFKTEFIPSCDQENNLPRIGRRESEPHSDCVTYLHDVLAHNFPQDRTLYDLHHYFCIEGEEQDVRYDISFFRNWQFPQTLSSYIAANFDNRIPTMAINILSKSTWTDDIGKNVDYSRAWKVPVYIIFSPYHVATKIYQPPFLRVYILQPDGNYLIRELHVTAFDEGIPSINSDGILDVGSLLPFRIALMKRIKTHIGRIPLFHLVLVQKEKNERFYTLVELETHRANQEKERAEKYLSLLKEKGIHLDN